MADHDVLGELLQTAAARLAAYGYLLTGSQHAGEDLVQDAIVKVFVKRRRLDNARAAEGYVRATMRTIHIDQARRSALWRRAAPSLVETGNTPDAAVAIADADQLARALAGLSVQERTAVVLRYLDDLKVQDVAAQMGLADGTVKRYLSNALAKLAAVVDISTDESERVHVVDRKG